MNPWSERTMLEPEELPRARDTDSSVQAQYEDSVPQDHSWDHEEDS